MQHSEIFFDGKTVRIAIDETRTVWFNASDACAVLGYTDTKQTLKDHVKIEGITRYSVATSGGSQLLQYIKESSFYKLILRSKMPKAEVFADYVTEEVLPSIRRSGAYVVTPERLAAVPFMAEIRARMEQIEKDFAFVPGAELKTVHEGLRRDRSPLGRLLWSLGTKTRKYTELCHRVATGTFNGPLWTLDRLEHNIKMLKEQIELQSARGVA